ncbi:MAG: hypothetical protein IT379_23595 [Deltaproteobacteria bacterium]|nr:hypothetical protein [Deltaproteobacteria bacterium]
MLTTAKSFDVVVPWDDAINHAHPEADLGQYLQTRDRKYAPCFVGKTPTVYHCRQLSRRMVVQHILPCANPDERRLRAFTMSVERVDNVVLETGDTRDTWIPPRVACAEPDRIDGMVALVDDRDLELFDLATILEVGEVVLTRAFFSCRSSEPLYQPPPSSLALLQRLRTLLAAADQSSAARASSSTPGVAAQATPSSPSDDSPGAATATG